MGNRYAWKHGWYSAAAIAERRRFRALLRSLKEGLDEINEPEKRSPLAHLP